MTRSGNDKPKQLCGQNLRIHIAYFIGISVSLLALDLTFSDERWFHWPVMIWGALLCVHLLYCKSQSVDDEWVEKRTKRIRGNSYDLGHIQNIEDGYKEGKPPEESEVDQRE